MENFQQVVVPGVAQERDSQMGFLRRYTKWGVVTSRLWRGGGSVCLLCLLYLGICG